MTLVCHRLDQPRPRVSHLTASCSEREIPGTRLRLDIIIGHFRNVRGLGKSMVVFRLFEKLKYSNERSTIF